MISTQTRTVAVPRRPSTTVQGHDLRAAVAQILDQLQRVRLRVHEPNLHAHHNLRRSVAPHRPHDRLDELPVLLLHEVGAVVARIGDALRTAEIQVHGVGA